MEPESKNLVSNNCSNIEIDLNKIHLILSTILSEFNLQGSFIDLSFVDSADICELNQEHRGKNSPTDVLSFPQWTWTSPVVRGQNAPLDNIIDLMKTDEALLLGDIVISPEMAGQNAEQINQPLDREVCFLMVHGVLHLCGHDHKKEDEEAAMISEQKFIMNVLDEPPLWQGCTGGLA